MFQHFIGTLHNMDAESYFPITRLFVGPEKAVVVSGPHFQVLKTSTGEKIYSTLQFSPEQQERNLIVKSGLILCCVVDETFRYLAEVGEDKKLKLWQISEPSEGGLELLNTRDLPKKPTSIMFTKDSQKVLVTDKFGDVFSYPLVYTPFTTSELETQKKEKEKDQFASHTNPSNGTLILGHVSPLNAILLSSDGKYIITSDRDEHIRVSWYPQGFNIEMYCFGHTKFVSALHVPSTDPSILISGGGDPVLKLWDWMTGQQKGELQIAEAIEPFIVIKKALGKSSWGADGDVDGDDGEEGGKGKKSKRKGKGQVKREPPIEQDPSTNAMDVDQRPAPAISESTSVSAAPQKILAIRRIETVVVDDAATFILFSAIGSTALFCSPYLPLSSGKQSSYSASLSKIQHLDFRKPVIDFYVLPSSSASPQQPLAWVILDTSWSADNESATCPSDRVRLVTISSSGELTEVDGERGLPFASLLKELNGPATTAPASEKELKSLDIYSELLSLPKIVEKPTTGEEDGFTGEGGSGSTSLKSGGKLTKRELGRRKRTTKVEEVIQKGLPGQAGTSQTCDLPEATGEHESEEEPDTKRARSSSQNADIDS